jgi:uncharacterized repeat protein (TIGR02543 family)
MRRKLLSIILCIAMLASFLNVFTTSVAAEDTYTVIFFSNGATYTTVSADSGSSIEAPTTPTRSGYNFDRWYNDQSFTTPVSFPYTVTGNITFYAKWTFSYSYTLSTTGATAAITGYSGPGGAVDIPATITDGGTVYTVTTIGASAFYGRGDITSIEIPNTVIQIYDSAFYYCTGLTSVTIPATLTTITHSAFSGCQNLSAAYFLGPKPSEFSGAPFGNTASGFTLYYPVSQSASWSGFTSYNATPFCTLTLDLQDSSIPVSSYVTVDSGHIAAPAAPARTGYTFGGWYKDTDFTAYSAFDFINDSVTSDMTLYAEWLLDTATCKTIIYNLDGVKYKTVTAEPGSSLAAPNTPIKAGYVFDNWYTDSSFTSTVTFPYTVTNDAIIYGRLTANSLFTVTFMSDGASYTTISTQSGSAISAPAPTRVGYHLDGWYTDQAYTSQVSFPYTVTADITLYAKWTFDFTYTLSGSEATITGYTGPGGAITMPSTITDSGTTYALTMIAAGTSGTTGVFSKKTTITSITISDSVTSIGAYAFYGCTGLTSVTIPNSVTAIGNYTFYGCSSLTSITLPNDVTTISDFTFNNCKGLTSILIPNSVTSIGSSAFRSCEGLTSIAIPDSVTSLGASSFYGCIGLTSLTIPNSVISIGSSAFNSCRGLASITISNSVTSLGDSAFSLSGLTSVIIPNSVTGIGSNVFSSCKSLTSVTIPNSVTSIGSSAFSNCTGLTSVTIPGSVTSLGDSAFNGCTGLTSVTIPGSVTSVAQKAFYGCSQLTRAYFLGPKPSNWGNNVFYKAASGFIVYYDVGYSAEWSSFTTYAKKPFCVLTLDPQDGSAPASSYVEVDSNGHISAAIAPTRTGYTFSGWYRDADCTYAAFDFSNNAVTGDLNLYAEWLLDTATCKTITFNLDGVKYKTVTIEPGSSLAAPNTPIKAGYVFDNWYTDVAYGNVVNFPYTVTDNATIYGKLIANSLFMVTFMSDGVIYTTVSAPSGSAISAPAPTRNAYTFSGWYTDAGLITAVSFPYTVTADTTLYAKWTFNFTYTHSGAMATITGYTGPNGAVDVPGTFTDSETVYTVTAIGNNAFKNKSMITSITIPGSVTSIGDYAFLNAGLTSVTIPSSVTSLSMGTFYGCGSLTSVIIPSSVTSLGQSAFGESGLTSITIPSSVTSIPSGTFFFCRNLTSVSIPSSVTSIDNNAFKNCSGLTSITIPSNVITVGLQAFYYCSNLSSAYFLGPQPAWGADVFGSTATGFILYYHVGQYTSWSSFSTYTSKPFCILTLDRQDGSAPVSSYVVVDSSNPVAPPADPTRSGYLFGGWYEDAACAYGIFDFANNTLTNDLTLYAQWFPTTDTSKTITFMVNGVKYKMLVVEPGTAVNAPTATKTGYVFENWYADAGYNTIVTFPYTVTENVSFYSAIHSFATVTFISESATYKTQTVTSGSTISAPEAPVKEGYTLDGWYTDEAYTTPVTFPYNVTADITLYAKWTANNYTITISSSISGGTVTADKSSAIIGEQVTLTVTPDPGKRLNRSVFYFNSTRIVGNSFGMPASDVTVTAAFIALPSNPNAWDGSIDTSWYNTSATSFNISTAAQLAGVAEIANGTASGIAHDTFYGKTITLSANVDMGGVKNQDSSWNTSSIQWPCISGSTYTTQAAGIVFNGTFDGGGHVISNLYINRAIGDWTNEWGNNLGLFGQLDPYGVVKNLGVTGYVDGNRGVGAIVGKNHGTVANCFNAATVIGHQSKGVGGIVGANWTMYAGGTPGGDSGTVTIINCYNVGAVTTYYGDAGGLVGSNEYMVINGYNAALVSGSPEFGPITAYGGGINCYYNSDFNSQGSGATGLTTAEMKTATLVALLNGTSGYIYVQDMDNINNGYPILAWQTTRTLPPIFTRDTTQNELGQPVVITFTDSAVWRGLVTAVTVNGTPVTNYSLDAGTLTLPASDFSTVGNYTVAVSATGYTNAIIRQAMNASANTLTITFVSDDSTYTTVSALSGTAINAPAAPTKANYTFNGWYSDQALANQVTFPYTVNGNVTLYAKWTDNSPTANTVTIAPVVGGTATVTTDAPNGRAIPGATVTVSIVIPSSAYNHQFQSITVIGDTTSNIQTMPVTTGKTYTFTMPSEAVTVSVELKLTPLEVYIQNGSTGTPAPLHSYTQADLEALATTGYYTGIDNLPAIVQGKARGVTLSTLINDLKTYDPGVFFGPGAYLILYCADNSGIPYGSPYTYEYLYGETRYNYPNLTYISGTSPNRVVNGSPEGAVTIEPMLDITSYQARSLSGAIQTPEVMNNCIPDTLNSYRFCFGLTENELAQIKDSLDYTTLSKFARWVNRIDIILPDTLATNITISPSTQTVMEGDTFEVSLAIDTAAAVRGWQLNIDFDASKLTANSVTEGSFLSDWAADHTAGTVSIQQMEINNTTGNIRNTGYLITGSTTGGPTGTGTLCTISFTAKQDVSGTANIGLSGATLSDTAQPPQHIEGVDVTGGSVTINAAGPETLAVDLTAGWNTFSTPVSLDPDQDTLNVLLPDDAYDVAYGFDASTQSWELISGDYQMQPCEAIYIKMKSTYTLTLTINTSLTAPPSKELLTGWNLISLANLESMKANEALTSVYEITGGVRGYSQVISQGVGSQKAWTYARDQTISGTEKGWMQPTEGYWVFMVNPGTLAGFSTTP